MTKANRKNPFGLTHRQCEVMESLVRLGDSKMVASELDVTYRVIDESVRCIVRRMGVRNRILAVLKWDRLVTPRTVFHGERPPNSVFALAANDKERTAA